MCKLGMHYVGADLLLNGNYWQYCSHSNIHLKVTTWSALKETWHPHRHLLGSRWRTGVSQLFVRSPNTFYCTDAPSAVSFHKSALLTARRLHPIQSQLNSQFHPLRASGKDYELCAGRAASANLHRFVVPAMHVRMQDPMHVWEPEKG